MGLGVIFKSSVSFPVYDDKVYFLALGTSLSFVSFWLVSFFLVVIL